jgi:hypothetical protein
MTRCTSYEIIGVLDRKGSPPSRKDFDDLILIPLSATRKRLVKRLNLVPQQVGNVSVKIAKDVDLKLVKAEIEHVLRIKRKISNKRIDNFHVRHVTAYVRAKRATIHASKFDAIAAAVVNVADSKCATCKLRVFHECGGKAAHNELNNEV